ncbi:MAG: flagellar basal body L-ring protein FlgH, partial [Planctomycetes bacterium]|nr:flagellar basal body L-ring protein FlgH [Planctomycetota bacterium]
MIKKIYSVRMVATVSLAVCLLAAVSGDCRGGSIWAKRSDHSKDYYADDKANQIGDVLTIIISEDHKVDSKVKSTYSKSTNTALALDGDQVGIDHIIPSIPGVGITASSSKSLDGKGDYKDERSITDRITVVVEDIHPNGNLVVIGTRSRDMSGDKQTIEV